MDFVSFILSNVPASLATEDASDRNEFLRGLSIIGPLAQKRDSIELTTNRRLQREARVTASGYLLVSHTSLPKLTVLGHA